MEDRTTYLVHKDFDLPQRYFSLVAEDTIHSDDEKDQTLTALHRQETYVRSHLPWRSEKATRLLEMIDDGRYRKNFAISGRKRLSVPFDHPAFKVTTYRAPSDLPIDCYDVRWYNSLNARRKNQLNPQPPIFLPDIEDIFSERDDISQGYLLSQFQDQIESAYAIPKRLAARYMKQVERMTTFRDAGELLSGLSDEDVDAGDGTFSEDGEEERGEGEGEGYQQNGLGMELDDG
jgi:hypothetical protein